MGRLFDWARARSYGLLGASGCGKTTLLSCIVGRRSFDSGEVLVFGGEPGTPESGIPGPRVGYMPQELALYGEFTIRETLASLHHVHHVSFVWSWFFFFFCLLIRLELIVRHVSTCRSLVFVSSRSFLLLLLGSVGTQPKKT